MLPEQIVADIRKQLDANESIHWLGKPDPVRIAQSNRDNIWLGLFFTLGNLALLVMTYTVFQQIEWWVRVIVLAFLGGGLLLVLSPRLAERKASRTVYVLTTRRALILSHHDNGLSLRESFDLMTFKAVQCSRLDDGTHGNVIINPRWVVDGDGYSFEGFWFRAVPKPEEVAALTEHLAAVVQNHKQAGTVDTRPRSDAATPNDRPGG